MKNELCVTRIRSSDPSRMSAECYDRANTPCNILVVIHVTYR
jgi:hypothetical protein